MPPGQMPAQLPVPYGTHAEPGGKPSATQLMSRVQAAQALGANCEPQKLLPAVVRVQVQPIELLQKACDGLVASQIVGVARLQVP
jgi:hypothetical protein